MATFVLNLCPLRPLPNERCSRQALLRGLSLTTFASSQLTSIVLLAVAWTSVQACGPVRAPEPPATPIRAQDTSASRMACDTIIRLAAAAGKHIYRDSEVEVPANLIFENRGPKHPDTRESATVQADFMVDSTGTPDAATFHSIRPVADKYLLSVRDYLPNARYKPARIGGRAVSQCVNQTFEFVAAANRLRH